MINLLKRVVSLVLIGSSSAFAQEVNSVAPIPDFPGESRVNAVSFSINDKIYVGAGDRNFSYWNDFWEFNPENSQWTKKANFPGGARNVAVSTVINGKAYFGLGQNASEVFSDWWEYDPIEDSWTKKSDYPGDGKVAAFSFSVAGTAYVGSGRMSNGQSSIQFWAYDPLNNSWSRKKDFEGEGRYFGTGFGTADAGYMGLGYNPNSSDFYSDFWKYDPLTNDWMRLADFGGGARSYAPTFMINQKGFVAGGMASNGFNRVVQSDIWEYDVQADVWEKKVNLPQPRSGLIAAATSSRAYLGLGLTGDPNMPSITYENSMWTYVPDATLNVSSPPDITCAGTMHDLEYVMLGVPIGSNNAVVVELSSKDGLFTNAKEIGRTVTSASDGIIAVTIPSDVEAGANYRVRLRSTEPSLIGKPNSTSLKISASDISVAIRKTSAERTCMGDPAEFRLEFSGEAVTPDFEWKKNNIVVGSNSNVFQDSDPHEGDVLVCRVIRKSGCEISERISEPLVLDVNELVTPTISVKPDFDITKICSGATVTFNAVVTHAGSAPQFKWKKNDAILASTTASLVTNSLNDDDKIMCILVSNESCVTSTTAQSNSLQLDVLPSPPKPTISMSGNTLYSSYQNGVHQWYFNGSEIPGATDDNYTIEESGVYTVKYIDECESISSPVKAVFTGIEHSLEQNVYPNPVTNELIIGGNNAAEIIVFDMYGKRISPEVVRLGDERLSVDFSKINPGPYLLQVGSQTVKIVKY